MYTGAIEIVTNVACHAHDISPLIFIPPKPDFTASAALKDYALQQAGIALAMWDKCDKFWGLTPEFKGDLAARTAPPPTPPKGRG
jgi:hypothetical protein